MPESLDYRAALDWIGDHAGQQAYVEIGGDDPQLDKPGEWVHPGENPRFQLSAKSPECTHTRGARLSGTGRRRRPARAPSVQRAAGRD